MSRFYMSPGDGDTFAVGQIVEEAKDLQTCVQMATRLSGAVAYLYVNEK